MGYEQLRSSRAFKRKELTVGRLRFVRSEGSVGDTSHALEDINPQHSSTEQHKVIKTSRCHGLFIQPKCCGRASSPFNTNKILSFLTKMSLKGNYH